MNDQQFDILESILGLPGAMLSGIKRKPRGCEDHEIYWNACVFLKTGKKDAKQIWHGDLDLTDRENDLRRLANELGETIYVTCEYPWRFSGFRESMKQQADEDRPVFQFDPDNS